MVEVSHESALGYMEIVHQRNAATLLPIIQSHIHPGTTIHSDQWAAYNNVRTLPGIGGHRTVNHSVEFVAADGTHTQYIESYWNRVKGKLKRMKVPTLINWLVTWMSLCGKNAMATKRVWPM